MAGIKYDERKCLGEASRAAGLIDLGNLDPDQKAFLMGVEFALSWYAGHRTCLPTEYVILHKDNFRRAMDRRSNITSSRPPELAGLWDQAEPEPVAVNPAAADD